MRPRVTDQEKEVIPQVSLDTKKPILLRIDSSRLDLSTPGLQAAGQTRVQRCGDAIICREDPVYGQMSPEVPEPSGVERT